MSNYKKYRYSDLRDHKENPFKRISVVEIGLFLEVLQTFLDLFPGKLRSREDPVGFLEDLF